MIIHGLLAGFRWALGLLLAGLKRTWCQAIVRYLTHSEPVKQDYGRGGPLRGRNPHRCGGANTNSPLSDGAGKVYLDTSPPYLDALYFGYHFGVVYEGCPFCNGDCSWFHWRSGFDPLSFPRSSCLVSSLCSDEGVV